MLFLAGTQERAFPFRTRICTNTSFFSGLPQQVLHGDKSPSICRMPYQSRIETLDLRQRIFASTRNSQSFLP
jgi:hypothetical protein